MSSLRERLRSVVQPRPSEHGLQPGSPQRPAPHARTPALPPGALETALDGTWRDFGATRAFVVEKRYEASRRHGRERIGQLAAVCASFDEHAALIARGQPRTPPVFFDLETTGLNGGAGTFAFLVGCGRFEPDGSFVTRQFVLARIADETPLLAGVTSELATAGALVSFNGKSFDAPLLETRYLFQRQPWAAERLPHVDVLHAARRFWGPVRLGAESTGADCSLSALERRVLGARRSRDIPGFEIPARYFEFLRTGNARPLTAVLEHNRLDLVSLAALTARVLDLVRRGAGGAGNAREALALGHVYARADLSSAAAEAFSRAIQMSAAPSGAFDAIRLDALRALAILLRRGREYERSAECWRQVVDVRGCPPHVAREANEALAIHHEHRRRDLNAARAFVLQLEPDRHEAARHRLTRIDRKLESLKSGFRLDA